MKDKELDLDEIKKWLARLQGELGVNPETDSRIEKLIKEVKRLRELSSIYLTGKRFELDRANKFEKENAKLQEEVEKLELWKNKAIAQVFPTTIRRIESAIRMHTK